MVNFAPDPDSHDDPERPPYDPDDDALGPDPRDAAAPTRTAQRVTMNDAKRWFDAGGDVVVSEYGHQRSLAVGRDSVVHNRNTTTWEALRTQVNEWRGRYPNQRYYTVPAWAAPHDPDDVADLVAHDAAVGLPGFTRAEPLPGSVAWAEQILTRTPAGVREQVSGATSTVLLSLAATVQQVGDKATRRRLLAGVVVDILSLAHGPGKIAEFRRALTEARGLLDEADEMAADEQVTEETERNTRALAQEAADQALAAAAVLLS